MSTTMKNGMILLIGICLMLVVNIEALNCYNCIYIETEQDFEGLVVEDTCGLEKIPLEKLSLDCSTLDYETMPEIVGTAIGIGLPNGIDIGKGSQHIKPHPNSVFTCVTFTFDGNFDNSFDWQAVKGTFRGCLISFDKGIDPQCHAGNMTNLIKNVERDEILNVLLDFSKNMDLDNTNAEICNCNEDSCNTNSSSVRVKFMHPLFYIIMIFVGIKRHL